MKKLLVLSLLLAGCVVRQDVELDGGFAFPDIPVNICSATRLNSDMLNCGTCGYRCDNDVSDRCILGICSCGPSPRCSSTQGCRHEVCMDSDPAGEVCEFDENCSDGRICIAAHCSVPSCFPEICDGLDNDCDGTADNTGPGPLARWCYDDYVDPLIPLVAPCMLGSQICQLGAWAPCGGSIPPIPEVGLLGCDGLDNDCDRCIDGRVEFGVCVVAENIAYDIIFAFDISGSMGPTINSVVAASSGFSSIYSGDPNFRFGIVVFPDRRGRPGLLLDLSDFSVFESTVATVSDDSPSGAEPSYDTIYDLGTGDLAVSWRRNTTRIIILFTDETFQSYRTIRTSETETCDALRHGEVLAVFVRSGFEDDIDECSDLSFELSTDVPSIISQLQTVIQDPCLALAP